MKKCSTCGNKCEDDVLMCENCGDSQFLHICPKCSHEFFGQHCPKCDTPYDAKPNICPNCKEVFLSNVCPVCGYMTDKAIRRTEFETEYINDLYEVLKPEDKTGEMAVINSVLGLFSFGIFSVEAIIMAVVAMRRGDKTSKPLIAITISLIGIAIGILTIYMFWPMLSYNLGR